MKKSRQPSPPERWRRWGSCGAGIALLTFAPKCLMCVAAYLGIGAALGLRTRELCVAAPRVVPAWVAVVAIVGAMTSIVWVFRCQRSLQTRFWRLGILGSAFGRKVFPNQRARWIPDEF